ncbi:unnamed protein product [Rotaria sp. Silwood2]|nr:unnamed protein product [Rotaria sp. Silwood2]
MGLIKHSSATRNLMIIWYHQKNVAPDVLRQMKIYLRKNFNYSCVFNNKEDLITYLASDLVIKQIVFIISNDDEKETLAVERLVKRRGQFRGLYRLELGKYNLSACSNIKEVRFIIEKMVNEIINDLQKTQQPVESSEHMNDNKETVLDESTPIFDTFKSVSAQTTFCNLSNESLKFLLFQALIELMVRIEYNEEDFKLMWNLCHQEYMKDEVKAKKIRTFAEEYKPEEAIKYYTQDSCFFRLVNQAFRLEDFDSIFRFGCYIADLHNQIEKLGREQRQNGSKNGKTYYRGKRYSIDVIQQFKDSIGHLIALNGLLSTTENYMTSTVFAGMGETQDHYQSVTFEFNIDSNTTGLIRPYANINGSSACQDEEEVLFFMGFVWKIESMKKIGNNDWYIVLQSCTDYNPELITYIEQARCRCTYMTVGNILQELGDHVSATNFYQRMLLDETLSDKTRISVYCNIAALAEDQGRYFDAVNYLIQAQNFINSTALENSEVPAQPKPLFAHNIAPSQLNLFNNMARAYMKAGNKVVKSSVWSNDGGGNGGGDGCGDGGCGGDGCGDGDGGCGGDDGCGGCGGD